MFRRSSAGREVRSSTAAVKRRYGSFRRSATSQVFTTAYMFLSVDQTMVRMSLYASLTVGCSSRSSSGPFRLPTTARVSTVGYMFQYINPAAICMFIYVNLTVE